MISNPGFEAPDAPTRPGLAADWTSTSGAALEQTAEFDGDLSVESSGYESFEHGWGSEDLQALETALSSTSTLPPEETFDLRWFLDQGFLFLAALEAASFDASRQAFEDFDDVWASSMDADIQLSSFETELLLFGIDPNEAFEHGWGLTPFSAPTFSFLFDYSGLSISVGSSGQYELFTLKLRQRVTSNVTTNKLEAANPPLLFTVGDAVTLVAENGELPDPLAEGITYLVDTIASDAITLVTQAGGAPVDLTADGSGAVYVLADPGRFWLDEF